MTTIELPDHLPLLTPGAHKRGSGKMCVMNALSYLQGDKTITDFPTCTDTYLSRMAQVLNDRVCRNRLDAPEQPGEERPLCGNCANTVWLFGAKVMGTSHPWQLITSPEAAAEAQWRAWTRVVGRTWPVSRHVELARMEITVLRWLQAPTTPGGFALAETLAVWSTTVPAGYRDTISALQALINYGLQYRRTLAGLRQPGGGDPHDVKTVADFAIALAGAVTGRVLSGLRNEDAHRAAVIRLADDSLRAWQDATGYPGDGLVLSSERVRVLELELAQG